MRKLLSVISFVLFSTVAVAAPSATQVGTTKTSNPYPVSILYNNSWYPMGVINTSSGNFLGLVANGGTGLSSGTSGGIPYFASTSTMASSAALTQYGVVYGGGAGAAPATTSAGTSNYVLKGNGSGAAPSFVSMSALLDAALSSTQGAILYRGASSWSALNPGTSGQVLTSGGSAANPSWAAAASSSTPIQPGGRLTLAAGVPVMQNTGPGSGYANQSTIYYAPYKGAYVPIYDGTTMQNVQFTSSVSDTTGLSLTLNSSWSPLSAYDVYVTMSGSSPVLCTVPWSSINPTPPAGTGHFTNTAGSVVTTVTAGPSDVGTRIQGILVNASTDSCRISGGSTISMAANRGTYLGSFYTDTSSYTVSWVWGGVTSGGSPAALNVWNYYNRVLVGAYLFDNGAPYTVTAQAGCAPTCVGVAARFARNSQGNTIQLMYGRAEDSITVLYQQNVSTAYVTGTTTAPFITTGYCINVWDYYAATTTFGIGTNGNSYPFTVTATNWATNPNAVAISGFTSVESPTALGVKYIFACEGGDGVNANYAGTYYGMQLAVSLPM